MAVAQGIEANKIFIHPPAFDLARRSAYRFDSARLYAQYPQLRDCQVVLSVARLVAQKRVDKALAASARLHEEFPRLVHVIVGDGPQRGALERLAREMGLGEQVLFTGALPNLSEPLFDLYSAAQIFVLPGVREGMGNVYLEAGAFALPCLGVADGGVPEIISDGETGLLAQVDDVEDLGTKLRALLKDEARAHQMGERAKARVDREFSTGVLARRAQAVLQEVTGNGQ